MLERLNEEAYDGAWAEGVHAVNALIDDLGQSAAETARVIEAVAEGDLSQHMALEIAGRPLRGEFLRIGRTVNTMVDQLLVVRRRGHPGRPRGRHRRAARRPGRRARRRRAPGGTSPTR